MQTPKACHGLRGARETAGPPRGHRHESSSSGQTHTSQGAQGGPYADVPPALALTATGTRDSPASCSPPHGGQWACRPHPVTPTCLKPPPPPIPWAGPAFSPSAQLTDPWPSTQASGAALRDLPAPRLASHATWHPTLPWSAGERCPAGREFPLQGGRGQGGTLPASSLARCPEPLTARHTAGAPRGRAGWPGVSPSSASSHGPLPCPSLCHPGWWAPRWDDVLGGTRCSERARPAWPYTVTHQPRAPRPSRRGWTPPGVLWNLLHVTKIPSDPARPAPSWPPRWSGHSHGARDTHSARAPTGRGYQGEDRLGQAQHVQVPCGEALRLPQGGPQGADPPTSWTPSRSPQSVQEGGGGACREHRGQTGQWPCWFSAFGAPAPAGPLGPQEPFVVWHFTHSRASPPLLSRQIPSVLPPRTAPFPLPRTEVPGPQPLPPRRLPPALSRELISPPETMQVSVWVKFRNARFLGKSMCAVINSAFPRALLRTQCRLRKRQEGQEASASGEPGAPR